MEISEFIEPATKVVEKIVECVQNKKEETCRTDKLWETRDNTLRIHSKLEYQLENLLSPGSIVSTIILSGVGGYGKTTAMHIRFNKEENNRIIYDRRNHSDWIRIKNNDLFPSEKKYLVIDNFRELEENDFKLVTELANRHNIKKLVLLCRKSNIEIQNKYIQHIDLNEYGFDYTGENIDKKILKVLPNCLKVPLYYNLLADFDYDSNELISLLKSYKKKNQYDPHKLITELLDIVFKKLTDDERELLTLFAMLVSDARYDEELLKELLREINLTSRTSIQENIYPKLEAVLEKYPVFTNNKEIKSKYFHSVFSDYFIEKFRTASNRKDFWKGKYFLSAIANINWKTAAGVSKQFQEKVKYIVYARNIIDFCLEYFDEIIGSEDDIDICSVKNFLNFFNSYSYMFIKTFNDYDEIELLQKLQGMVIASITKDKIKEKWVQKFPNDKFYYAQSQFYIISSKVELCLAVYGEQFSLSNYKNAVELCDKSRRALVHINNEVEKNIRESMYSYTKAMILYKGALFFDSPNVSEYFKVNMNIRSKKELLKEAMKYIKIAEKNDKKDIQMEFNITDADYDFRYNIDSYNNLSDEIRIDDKIGSFLGTLELKCIIKSQIVALENRENEELRLLLKFTSNGFHSEAGEACRDDKMRFREVLLMQLLFTDDENDKNRILDLLNSDYVKVKDFEDKRFIFLRALAFKYIGINDVEGNNSYSLSEQEYLSRNNLNKRDLWNTLFKYIIA